MKPSYVKSSCTEFFAKPAIVIAVFALLIGGMVVLGTSVHEPVSARSFTALAESRALDDELRIELRANGFVPSAVQHAAGTFAIAVENSAISGEYTLRLKAEDGTVVKEIEVQKGSVAWTITLQAGNYTLTETSHPQWLCQITVQ